MHYLSTNKTFIKKQSVKKMAKFKIFMASNFFMQMFNVSTDYIVYAKYKMASVKALVKVDFLVHVLPVH